MFYSYNSKQFAKEVKNIRLNLKYSQSYVSKITKISIDGLRKIECGSVTPRFETLVKLSELYKVNLIEMMVLYSKIPNLVEAYNNIQFYIDTENVKEIDIAVKDIKASTQKYIDEGIILLEEVMQFINFCEASKLYIKNSKKNLIKSKALVIEALKMTIKNFDMSVIIKNKYNYFEIRLLNLLALIEQRLNNHDTSIFLLKFLLKTSEHAVKNVHSIKNTILIYFNLSYAYYEIGNHRDCLKYAEAGIEFSIKHSRLNEMHLLYYRKGIAEYFLDISSYMDSLSKSVILLEVINNPLADLYRQITMDKYRIKIK